MLAQLEADVASDLLLFHREHNCLVAIEPNLGRFEPDCLAKLTL